MSDAIEILLVDDDPDIRDAYRLILESGGYAVRTARNGDEALAEIEDKAPALMILDVMMSTDTEGFELAEEIRSRPDMETVPIIMMTSFLEKVRDEGPEAFQHVLGMEWPARWIFEKPVTGDQLLAKIASLLAEAREA